MSYYINYVTRFNVPHTYNTHSTDLERVKRIAGAIRCEGCTNVTIYKK